tara:strand:+ start:1639 stop:2346 length:708 start_codon:yes stop_codon:yes gene_type:complete
MRILKLAVLATLFLSGHALSQESTSSQTEYQISFISAVFDLVRVFGAAAGLILILWLSINFALSVSEKGNQGKLQQLDYKPVTLFRYMMGMLFGMVLFFQPFTLMSMFGDLINKDDNTVCLVLDIKDPWAEITGKGGDECLTALKADIAGSVDVEAIDNNTLRLFFGSLQLVSLIFFLVGGTYFMLNMLGSKNMRITTGKSLIIVVASSFLMISPSLISLAEDLRDANPPSVTTR